MSYQSISSTTEIDSNSCENARAPYCDLIFEEDAFLKQRADNHIETLQKMLNDS